MAATTAITEDNTTDQQTQVLEGVSLVMNTSLHFLSILQHRAVHVTPPKYAHVRI